MSDRAYTSCWPALLLSLLWTISLAHHSFAAFDTETELVIDGEILEFEWTNPHTRTAVRVVDDDRGVVVWDIEGMSPDYLGRRGWTRTTLRPGDIVTVTIYPLRSGEPGGTFLRAVLEDGTVVVMFAR